MPMLCIILDKKIFLILQIFIEKIAQHQYFHFGPREIRLSCFRLRMLGKVGVGL